MVPSRTAIHGFARWRSAALGWFALAIAGQVGVVAATTAGPSIGYAHLLPPDGWPAWALALLVVETLLVAAGAWRRRAALARLVRGRSVLRTALFALVFVGTAAALSQSVSWYLAELALAATLQAVSLGAVVFGVMSLPDRAGRGFMVGVLADDPGRPRLDRFAWAVAGWTVAVTLLLAVVAYERHPHVPDEVGYLLQAAYFADGRLAMDAPPVPAAFDIDLMQIDGNRWYSPLPPGWPAALAIGSGLGVPWAVNPVLAGLVVLLGYLLAWRLYGRRVARLTALLLAASPWLLFLGMSFMGHPLTLAIALGGALAVARSRDGGSSAWALVAGALTGAVSLVRPLDGVAVAIVLGVWVAVDLGRRAVRLVPALAFGSAALLTGAIQLIYNRAMTGSALTFPLMPYFDRLHSPGANALGFGPDRGFGWTGLDPFPGHDLMDVGINAALNGSLLNVELFGWSAGSLFLIAGFLLFARPGRKDVGIAAAALVVVAVYAFYWFSGGPDFGPRYWSLVLFPAAALTARAIAQLTETALGARAVVGATLLSLSALLVFVPWRAVDKYHDYRGMRPDVRELAEAHGFGRSLVLIRGDQHPDYGSAAVYLPVDPHADAPIYAWDRSPEVRRQLLGAYPDRPVWFLDGPTVTGDGYRVTAGPVPDGPSTGEAE